MFVMQLDEWFMLQYLAAYEKAW